MLRPGVLSILIPLYNEEQYIGTLLSRVLAAPLPEGLHREVVIVDDCSTDSSAAIADDFQRRYPDVIRLFRNPSNRGKGAAIHAAIKHARGEYSIVQDADLEYDPRDYRAMLGPLVDGRADAVFGSRFLSSAERRVLYFWHAQANWLLTTACNLVSDLNLSDMETCYKAVRTSLLQSLPLQNERFGFEPEVTIKLAKRRAVIYEVPISYNGRTYEEGKKIGLKDAFEALWTIGRCALTTILFKDNDQQILHAFSQAPRFNRWMADTIRPFLGSRVLEIGAGMGNLTRQLSPRLQRYVATDLNPQYLHELQRKLAHQPHLEVSRCNLEQPADFVPYHHQMESVVCLNVLEHVENDLQGLRNIYSVLKPGGRALVLVPEGPGIYGTLDKVLGHYRRYTSSELRQKMEATGFRVERIIPFNRISRPGWFVTGRVLKKELISPLQLRIFDRFVWLWRRIDGLLPWKPTSIIGVAVKE